MKIICNHAEKEIKVNTTLLQLMTGLQLNPDTVVAEIDGTIIRRQDYDTLVLRENNTIELIRFVGGG